MIRTAKVGNGIRAWVIDDFLSAEECDHLRELGEPSLVRSQVVDFDGIEREQAYRTSSQSYLTLRQDEVVESVEERIAQLTHLPVENGEGMQILRYRPGELYRPHTDFFDPNDPPRVNQLQRGGQRLVSAILYLNDVEEGGHTFFSREFISVPPKKGRILVFCNVDSEGGLVWNSMHEGQPPKSGDKWIANKWIHERAFV